MKKTEAVTPPQVVEKLLKAAGTDVVLVGGQALAVWIRRYGLAVPDDVAAITADVDFLTPSAADRDTVKRFAKALQGQAHFPNIRALTSLVGQAWKDISDDEYLNVDVIFDVLGITPEQVRQRSVAVEAGDIRFLVMHPLHVLRSRLINLHKVPDKQNEKGCVQLALAIAVARAYLSEVASKASAASLASGRSPLQGLVSEVERMALEDAGRKVARRYGLHVADAIDPSMIPAGPFWTRKWPELSRLMSREHASMFNPPA